MIKINSNILNKNKLIPREELFRLSPYIGIKISPDGKRLASVGGDKAGIMNLYTTSNLSLKKAEQVTHFIDPEIKAFYWSPDSTKVLLLKDQDGKKQFRLYSYDLKTRRLIDLTAGFANINAKVFQISVPMRKAVIGINARNPRFHDLFLLDFSNDSLTLTCENDQFIHFLFDARLRPIIKVHINADCSMSLLNKEDRELFLISPNDAFHTECLKFDTEENALYLLDNRDSNTTQLKKIHLDETLSETLVSHDSRSDIRDVVFEADKPIAYSTYYTHREWHPLNEKTREDLQFLVSKMGANFEIVDQTLDCGKCVIKNHIPEQGVEFWLYHRTEKQLSLLYASPKSTKKSKMYPLRITSQDKKELVSYLTLPREKDREGKPTEPLPMVVIPHGGPFKARDLLSYSPFHQWLANRGYAVLSVNFRLSSGFGKDFVNAGNGEWGKKAHQDIVDAVNWCIDAKIADADKLAVFGISYGGYEALASLTFTPDFFACAIAICGPSNLKTVLDHVPFYWELTASPLSDKLLTFSKNAFITSMGGDPDKKSGAAYLQQCSPLNYVDRIKKPLLLVHGKNDPIVAASESDQIFEKMRSKKLPVLYLSFPDEGHAIAKVPNQMCYLAYSEWLLAQILGGDYEPISEKQLNASSAIIQTYGMKAEEILHGKH